MKGWLNKWLPATKADLLATEARIIEAMTLSIPESLRTAAQQLSAETKSLESAVKANQPVSQPKDKSNDR